MIAPASAVALVPDELPAVEAAPLMCAGVTTFNCAAQQRRAAGRPGGGARPGRPGPSRRAIRRQMGFETVAIARGKDKEPLARKLGAIRYIDSQTQDPAAELQKLGGAKVILATVTNGDAMSAVVGGLAVDGTLMVIGAAPSMTVSPLQLLIGLPVGEGLVFRHVDRFAGHAGIQRADRRALDERSFSAANAPRKPTSA